MSNKEQSSVEWLVEVVSKMGYVSTEILEQAKAMNKEETCQFVSDYLDDAADYTIAEEYYDQIYGGNNG